MFNFTRNVFNGYYINVQICTLTASSARLRILVITCYKQDERLACEKENVVHMKQTKISNPAAIMKTKPARADGCWCIMGNVVQVSFLKMRLGRF